MMSSNQDDGGPRGASVDSSNTLPPPSYESSEGMPDHPPSSYPFKGGENLGAVPEEQAAAAGGHQQPQPQFYNAQHLPPGPAAPPASDGGPYPAGAVPVEQLYPQQPAYPGAAPYAPAGGPTTPVLSAVPVSDFHYVRDGVMFKFDKDPAQLQCQFCHKDVTTAVTKKNSLGTWATCAGSVWFFCLFCGCCLVPFFMDAWKVFEHHCPECQKRVGKYHGSFAFGEC